MTEAQVDENEEIYLIEMIHNLVKGRKTILITILIFLLIGIILLLISPKSYRSEATLLIETEATSAAGMSNLMQEIAIASGINMNQKQVSDALTPDLYPIIVTSTPFLLDLLNRQVPDPESGKSITIAQYLEKHPPRTLKSILMSNTVGLPGKLIGLILENRKSEISPKSDNSSFTPNPLLFSSDSLSFSPSAEQLINIGKLKLCIEANTSIGKGKPKTGNPNILTVSTQVNDPEVSFTLTSLVITSLTKYITEYRTRKVKNDLQFINDQLAEAEIKYYRTQQTLAASNDRNQNIIFASARTDEARHQAEYTLAFNVFNSLSQLREQAKIKVQEKTPVFTMIEPPSKAVNVSSSFKIIVIMIFLGIFTGVGIVFGKPAWKKFKTALESI